MWRSISVGSWTKTIKIFHLDQFWYPCRVWTRKHPSICESEGLRMRRRNISDREEKLWMGEEGGWNGRTAIQRACAENPDKCNISTRQRRSAPKLMHDDASADGRQTVPCRPNKKSFWLKKCKNRRTNILLVGFHLLKYNEHLGTYVHNVSFPELHIFSVGSNEIYQYDLFQIF